MEKLSTFEHRESNESPEEKHNKWIKEARIMLEGIGFHVIVGVSAFYILQSLGVDLPPPHNGCTADTFYIRIYG